MFIKIKDLLNRSLDGVFSVERLFDVINNSEDNDITLDFTNVEFITLSFTQAYMFNKMNSDKNIKEINLSEDNKISLNDDKNDAKCLSPS